jgi:predicted ATPase
MIAHRLMGISLMDTGDIAEGRAHYDEALALYEPAEHRWLATRFGQDAGVTALGFRAKTLWLLGHAEAALADADHAVRNAREIHDAASLLWALFAAATIDCLCGYYTTANARLDELVALADEKDAALWRASAMLGRGWLCGLAGGAADAVQMITSGIATWRSTGSTVWMPFYLSYLARAYSELGQVDDAWRCIEKATTLIETTNERWCEAEVNRTVGEIALISPEPEAAKAELYFERALAVARQQQAKSWELRTATSMARLWRDQGKHTEAHDLLAPVYGWFTEGFNTLDLKEAKALLEQLRV